MAGTRWLVFWHRNLTEWCWWRSFGTFPRWGLVGWLVLHLSKLGLLWPLLMSSSVLCVWKTPTITWNRQHGNEMAVSFYHQAGWPWVFVNMWMKKKIRKQPSCVGGIYVRVQEALIHQWVQWVMSVCRSVWWWKCQNDHASWMIREQI